MTFNPRRFKSIHGRRMQLTSTGNVMDGEGYGMVIKSTADVVQNSTALLFAQIGLSAQSDVASSVGSTLTNYGLQRFSSGQTAGLAVITGHEIETPVVGVVKTIHFGCSASSITFGGTSTAMVFQTAIAGAGSTLFIWDAGAGLAGGQITLMGFASSEWSVISITPRLALRIG